jgi:hypothetical protein
MDEKEKIEGSAAASDGAGPLDIAAQGAATALSEVWLLCWEPLLVES